jgi:C-terminal processing protease CtpA/Prc
MAQPARYPDTWDFGFFDRTGKVTRNADGTWRYTDPPADVRIQPTAPRFTGTVAALIGPRMSSAGFLLARDLRASGRAVLIGEPTGGNRRGLNGGQIARLTLPYSGVAVDIPLQATIHDGEPDAPILPDIPVSATIADVIAKRDAALEKALLLP